MPEIQKRRFRLSMLRKSEFRYVWMLLFWPIFGMLFGYLERGCTNTGYYPVHCALDDKIPFCEYFLIPYLFWFVYLGAAIIVPLFVDVPVFKKTMRFIMLTYTITIVIYILFPTCQNLRPAEFARGNVLTRLVARFYQFDTNTNVCPSIHVIGSVAAMLCFANMKPLQKPVWQVLNIVSMLLICISTVFLKQHSVIDVLAAIPVCGIGYLLGFRVRENNPNGGATR